jgi:hypothetical protein
MPSPSAPGGGGMAAAWLGQQFRRARAPRTPVWAPAQGGSSIVSWMTGSSGSRGVSRCIRPGQAEQTLATGGTPSPVEVVPGCIRPVMRLQQNGSGEDCDAFRRSGVDRPCVQEASSAEDSPRHRPVAQHGGSVRPRSATSSSAPASLGHAFIGNRLPCPSQLIIAHAAPGVKSSGRLRTLPPWIQSRSRSRRSLLPMTVVIASSTRATNGS